MLAMALFCLVLMMTTRIMMNREAPREMEDKLRWKLKLLRVELMRLSCISEWLSASILLSTLRLGRWKPSELGSIEPKAMIPNMRPQGVYSIGLCTDHRVACSRASQLRPNRKQGRAG